MHLCEQFQKGEPLPPQLPVRFTFDLLCAMHSYHWALISTKSFLPTANCRRPLLFSLIPPQMRRAAKDAGLIGTPGSGMNSGIGSPASFEVLQQICQ